MKHVYYLIICTKRLSHYHIEAIEFDYLELKSKWIRMCIDFFVIYFIVPDNDETKAWLLEWVLQKTWMASQIICYYYFSEGKSIKQSVVEIVITNKISIPYKNLGCVLFYAHRFVLETKINFIAKLLCSYVLATILMHFLMHSNIFWLQKMMTSQ